jgi:hypothetical protein
VALRGDDLVETAAAVVVVAVDDALGPLGSPSSSGARGRSSAGDGVARVGREAARRGVGRIRVFLRGVILRRRDGGVVAGKAVGVGPAAAVEVGVEGDGGDGHGRARGEGLLHLAPLFLRLRELSVYRVHGGGD